jgi:hypothetical protein
VKCALLLAVLAACNARLGTVMADAPPVTPDVRPVDAPADATPCTGGDGHASDGSGNCFVFFLTPKTWVNAKAACDAMPGAHFAVVTSAAQNAIIAGLAAGHATFLGMTDSVTEGMWVWVDGTPIGYNNWRSGVPDNGGGSYQEDCLVIEGNKTPNDTWDDRPCDPTQVATSGSFPYICEY